MSFNINSSGVYKVTCVPTGNIYVGSAVNFRKRWSLHKRSLRSGDHHSKYLQASWNKYGADAFVFEPLLVCDASMVLVYEQIALDFYKPVFNTAKTAGSNAGIVWSDETKSNMSLSQRKWRPKYEWKGESLCLSEIAELEGFDYTLLVARVLGLGKTLQEALAMGDSQIKLHEYNGESKNVSQWAAEFGIHTARLNHYIKHGCSVAEARRKMDRSEKAISFSEFCKVAGANMTTTKSRINKGMGVMQAVTGLTFGMEGVHNG